MWKLDKDAGGNTWLISPAGDWVATFSRDTPSHICTSIVRDLNTVLQDERDAGLARRLTADMLDDR